MRRVLSIVFLVIGGWLLTSEPMVAFADPGPDVRAAHPIILVICLVMAAAPLAIGIALSPGDRRRELGLTILIALGTAAFSGVAMAAVFLDPGSKSFMPAMPPMPEIRAAPIVGTMNLIVLTAIGWWLYRGRKFEERA